MDLITWFFGYWSVLIWAVPIALIFTVVNHLFGYRISLPLGVLGSFIVMVLIGKKIERDNQRKYVQDIEDKRDEAYEKINDRNTDQSDVLERLRKRDF